MLSYMVMIVLFMIISYEVRFLSSFSVPQPTDSPSAPGRCARRQPVDLMLPAPRWQLRLLQPFAMQPLLELLGHRPDASRRNSGFHLSIPTSSAPSRAFRLAGGGGTLCARYRARAQNAPIPDGSNPWRRHHAHSDFDQSR